MAFSSKDCGVIEPRRGSDGDNPNLDPPLSGHVGVSQRAPAVSVISSLSALLVHTDDAITEGDLKSPTCPPDIKGAEREEQLLTLNLLKDIVTYNAFLFLPLSSIVLNFPLFDYN